MPGLDNPTKRAPAAARSRWWIVFDLPQTSRGTQRSTVLENLVRWDPARPGRAAVAARPDPSTAWLIAQDAPGAPAYSCDLRARAAAQFNAMITKSFFRAKEKHVIRGQSLRDHARGEGQRASSCSLSHHRGARDSAAAAIAEERRRRSWDGIVSPSCSASAVAVTS